MVRDAGWPGAYVGRDITLTTKEVVVLKRQSCGADGSLKVTFVLPTSDHERPVSVLGTFNGWDPLVHPLK